MMRLGRLFRRETVAPAADAAVRVAWAAATAQVPFANLGDALSPVIVAALTGVAVAHADFDEPVERLAAVGTIGHALRGGLVHLWGTGLDRNLWPKNEGGDLRRAPAPGFRVHATRGPLTRAVLMEAGLDAPAVYGDPVLLLPHLFALTPRSQYELGVIPHLSELDRQGPDARPKAEHRRYHIPSDAGATVRLIHTWTAPRVTALFERIAEILSCRRILTKSLHGLIIAEAFGIPALYIGARGRGPRRCDLAQAGHGVDHRFADYYLGTGRRQVWCYVQRQAEPTDWADAIAAVDAHAQPVVFDPAPLIDAFPLPRHWSAPLPTAPLPDWLKEIEL
ncbi:polysaccharide pyruvyl transferase family protein [Oleomonas cavernae]|uniref:Polysaccharide pyruvyl transferase family protein n=1 Tax=Oleomonas cavernae TaxID=2320859 RepID=A0A418WTD4_9PROT|nr:polysaccharide pyruvyl transferase family protein [Oleomonas cavernae]RJF94488.1 polysaccharide pyruvyl transferase family protein [Oleomonas cavernae]